MKNPEKNVVNLAQMDGGLFTYKTLACNSYINEQRDKSGKRYYNIKIQKKEKVHCYCFTTNSGLIDISIKRTSKQNDDTEEYARETRASRIMSIITEIPASPEIVTRISLYKTLTELRFANKIIKKNELKSNRDELMKKLENLKPRKCDRDYIESVSEYLEKYGYLFGAPKGCTNVPIDNLASFYDRLYVILTLISELQAEEIFQNADTLLFCTTYLLNAPPKKVLSFKGDKTEHITSYSHKFHEFWKNALNEEFEFCSDIHCAYGKLPNKQIKIADPLDEYIFKNYSEYAKLNTPDNIIPHPIEFERIVYDSLEKENVHFSFKYINGIIVDYNDVIIEDEQSTDDLLVSDDNFITMEEVGKRILWPVPENKNFFDKMCNLYVFEGLDPDIKEIVDILMRLYCAFPEMKESDCGAFYFPGEGINASNFLSVKHKHKELLIKLAKMVLKDELDYHLKDIHPTFNIETMSADWIIPDLLTAMYFSIFYTSPKHKIFKPCARPDCSKFIIVNDSNYLTRYCSDRCKNIVTQRNKRRLEKEIQFFKNKNDESV